MKIFRNREIVRSLIPHCFLTLTSVFFAYLANRAYALPMLVTALGFTAIHFISTYKRYKKIAELSADIDTILHGGGKVSLERYAEGELGILQSEINKMTVRLREQQNRLIKDKMYLADSIADISHQIRTPLTSVNLLVSRLAEPDMTEERRLQLSRELYELLGRIDRLITSLLKISRLDTGTVKFKSEKTPLDTLIKSSVSPLLVPIELRGLTLTVKADGDFTGDISWTEEAVLNIVKNCMEHTPAGGEINITASDNALFSEIVIEDNGKGISKEDLPHIFERFYKGSDSDAKSFGIGLALARTIINTQNGTVKAENRQSGGARFIIKFYKGTV